MKQRRDTCESIANSHTSNMKGVERTIEPHATLVVLNPHLQKKKRKGHEITTEQRVTCEV